MMARELGVISHINVAEFLLEKVDSTIAFDATTTEGVHVNSVYVTSTDECNVISIDQVAGGTSEDYEVRIPESVNQVVDAYRDLYNIDFDNCRPNIISYILNSMNDRDAVNHATFVLLEASWSKSLNEFNDHLHLFETVARSWKTELKYVESDYSKGKRFGYECTASNIVLAVNPFRYKDGKRGPKGSVPYLNEAAVPKGIIPRYE